MAPIRGAGRRARRVLGLGRVETVALGLLLIGLAVAAFVIVLSAADHEPEAVAAPDAPVTTYPVEPTALVTTTQPTTTTTRGPLGSGEAVTIAFGGDSHFENHLRSQLDSDPTGMLAPLAPLFAGSDLNMVNLETAIAVGGTRATKEYTFRAPPTVFDALRAGGINVVTEANNHGMDYGPDGLAESLAARDASGFPVIGVGHDADEAYAPYETTIKGQRIAVIGATQVLDDQLIAQWTATDTQPGLASAKNVDRLVAEVRDVRERADTVVVFLHWGLERNDCPTTIQQDLAPQLLDAGADIVVGSHAHRLQGAGRMGDGFVAYGLGNFIWFNESGVNGDTGVLQVTATGRQIDSYEWRPARIQNGIPTPLEGAARDAAIASWDALRGCTGLEP